MPNRPRIFRPSLALVGITLGAQTPGEDLSQELLDLLNTPIVSASKRETRLMDSPQAIEVLTGDEIRQQGIHRLVDALRLMTSVDVLELGNNATYVSMRGVMQQGSPLTTQILVDGVPLYNSFISAVDFDNLPVPVDVIEKVEVVRGPSSAVYGANAVVGVISITTKRAGEKPQGGLRLSRANLTTWRGGADAEIPLGNLSLVAGYNGNSMGSSSQPSYDFATLAPATFTSDQGRGATVFARGGYKAGASEFWINGGDAIKYAGVPSPSIPLMPQFWRGDVQTTQAGWRQKWAPSFQTELRASRLVERFDFGPLPALAAVTGDLSYNQEFKFSEFITDLMEFQFNWDLSSSLHAVGGADRRTYHNEASKLLQIERHDQSASGGFLNLDWNPAPAWSLTLGARAENETLGGSRVSPRAVLSWNPNSTSSLRAGYYTATRSPQINQTLSNQLLPLNPPVLFTQSAPNPGLQPEKVTSGEVGYRQQFGAFNLDLTLFRMEFSQLIKLENATSGSGTAEDPTIMSFKSVNVGKATTQGLELAASYLLRHGLSLGLNSTWLDATEEGLSGRPDYTPAYKGNLWFRFALDRWSGQIAFQHVGPVGMNQPFSPSSAVPIPTRPRKAVDVIHLNLNCTLAAGFTAGIYARNANHEFVDMGIGGPGNIQYLCSARREVGGTLGYRF